MAHVHFDAKYRVDNIRELLGDITDDEAFERDTEAVQENRTAAKYSDLLKMHAYRDAVRRTAGAYVLYPGNPGDNISPYNCFHEILPGLGAFAIRPNAEGEASGIDSVANFSTTSSSISLTAPQRGSVSPTTWQKPIQRMSRR